MSSRDLKKSSSSRNMEELIPYTTIFSPSLSIGCKNLRPNSSLRLSLKLWSTCMNKTLFIETSKLRTYSWIETKNWNSSTSALVWNLFRPVPSILFVELRLTWPPKSYQRETTCLSTLIYGVLECFCMSSCRETILSGQRTRTSYSKRSEKGNSPISMRISPRNLDSWSKS